MIQIKSLLRNIKTAFHELLASRFNRVAICGVVLISILFGTLYITAFWDPIGKMQDLPVAIINLDQGVEQDGEWKNYGDTIATEMADNKDVKWVEETQAILDGGLENSEYFLACIIPENFSQHVISAQDGEPVQAELAFFANARKNFFLTSIGAAQIQSNLERIVNQNISAEYVHATYEGLFWRFGERQRYSCWRNYGIGREIYAFPWRYPWSG